MPVGRSKDYAASGISGYLERIIFMADGLCAGMELGVEESKKKAWKMPAACHQNLKTQSREGKLCGKENSWKYEFIDNVHRNSGIMKVSIQEYGHFLRKQHE